MLHAGDEYVNLTHQVGVTEGWGCWSRSGHQLTGYKNGASLLTEPWNDHPTPNRGVNMSEVMREVMREMGRESLHSEG